MQKIFVIEDDENIRNLVKIALEGYGYQVLAFETAEEALELVGKEQPDLAVFDLMLPGMDGLSAIRLIRNRDDEIKNIPIIVLTAKDKEYDKVVGLDGGADDYVTKPFGVLELAARIRSLLRRSAEQQPVHGTGKIKMGGLAVDTAAREVVMNGETVSVTTGQGWLRGMNFSISSGIIRRILKQGRWIFISGPCARNWVRKEAST